MRYDSQAMKEFTVRVMEAAGLSGRESRVFADSLIRADMRGISSHGLTRLATYARRVEQGLVAGHVEPKILRDGGTLLVLDGQNGMGAWVGTRAMALCIQRAEQRGSCFAAVGRGNHFGYAAYFTEQAAERGMLGLAIANGPKALPPTGGARALLGTNPLAVSLPGGGDRPPVTLDMATRAVARGKVTLAQKTGRPIPEGWGVDKDGNPTTDPGAVLSGGAMLPVGGPKGYALSLLIEILCSCLTGADNGQTMGSFYDFSRTQNTGYCFAALNLAGVVDAPRWAERMDALLGSIQACPRRPGVERILLPGQPERENWEKAKREGISLPPAVEEELQKLGAHFQVDLPAPLG